MIDGNVEMLGDDPCAACYGVSRTKDPYRDVDHAWRALGEIADEACVIEACEACGALRRRPIASLLPQDEASGVSAFFGTWPGDESDEELLEALKAIR